MTLPGKPGRMVPIILRAVDTPKQRWVDNIRVQYCAANDDTAVGFAKCLGFFGDANSNNYVAIQWYRICGRPTQRLSCMCKVELIESYQYIPVGSILNGALMVPLATEPAPGYPQQFWVLQSKREADVLTRINT